MQLRCMYYNVWNIAGLFLITGHTLSPLKNESSYRYATADIMPGYTVRHARSH